MAVKVNKEFSKYSWVYPGRNPKYFKGAIQEYKLKNGGVIAVAFMKDGAYVLEDDNGDYFATIDYIAKGGLFDEGTPLRDYEECRPLAHVFIAETGNSIEDIILNESNINKIPFEDKDFVKEDIVKRLRVVGIYGFFTVFKGF